MLNFIISTLLQICSKEPSLVGRATRQEPARSGLTVTLTPFRAPETSQAGLCARLWDRPAPVLCRHLPTMSHPLLPPLRVKLWFSILNKTAEPARQSGSSPVSLFPAPQDSTCSRAAAQGLQAGAGYAQNTSHRSHCRSLGSSGALACSGSAVVAPQA